MSDEYYYEVRFPGARKRLEDSFEEVNRSFEKVCRVAHEISLSKKFRQKALVVDKSIKNLSRVAKRIRIKKW
jgi:hypothetical protein